MSPQEAYEQISQSPRPLEGETFISRAVLRSVEQGGANYCAAPECGNQIKYTAKEPPKRVIANVYEGGVWQRVEVFHPACYESTGLPYGPAHRGHAPMTAEQLALNGVASQFYPGAGE